jgi:Transposase DDE domain group 1
MSVWNGHYECTCYHPLFVFNQFGDLERCALRPGNVHSADGWESVLKPVVARYRGKVSRIYFRADAGFANPDVYEYLEAECSTRLCRSSAQFAGEPAAVKLWSNYMFALVRSPKPPQIWLGQGSIWWMPA